MKGQATRSSASSGSFPWRGVAWTVILAIAAWGLHGLRERHMLSDGQLAALLFAAIPVAAFTLSRTGRHRSGKAKREP